MTAISPRIATIHIGTPLYRIVAATHGPAGALFFGPAPGRPPSGRFDSAAGAFRVCYLAESMRGAFAESLLRRATPPDLTSGIRALAASDITASALAMTVTTRALRLADVRDGHGLAPLGLTGAVTMGESHDAGRALSDTIHALSPHVDGIYFRTRHDPAEYGVAVFDRAASALGAVTPLAPLLDDMRFLSSALDWYAIALDD